MTAAAACAAPRDWVPGPQSHHPVMQLALAAFSGPLDLLLLLIRRHQLDIFDIPMQVVCRQYLGALGEMDAAGIDVGAEFVALAAELVAIKSQTLLPTPPAEEEAGDDGDQADPRVALVARLLEHQKYRQAARELAARPLLGRDTFAVAGQGAPPGAVAPAQLRPARVVQLAQAFHALMRRHQAQEDHQVVVEPVSVRARMEGLVDALGEVEQLAFAACLPAAGGRLALVVTFLALLEMTRLRLCGLWEEANGALWVRGTFPSPSAARQLLAGAEEAFR